MVPRRDSRGDHPSLPRYPSTMAQPKRKDAAEPPLWPERFRRWFEARGWTPRPHQLALLAKAREGRSALLIAPTAAGQTLARLPPPPPPPARRPPSSCRPSSSWRNAQFPPPLKGEGVGVGASRALDSPPPDP